MGDELLNGQSYSWHTYEQKDDRGTDRQMENRWMDGSNDNTQRPKPQHNTNKGYIYWDVIAAYMCVIIYGTTQIWFHNTVNVKISMHPNFVIWLTHWSRVTHICVSRLTIIGSDNGLLPDRRQAIIWTNAGILLMGPLGTNFSEILIKIYTFSFRKMHLKTSGKWRPCCLGLNVLNKVPVIPLQEDLLSITRQRTNLSQANNTQNE